MTISTTDYEIQIDILKRRNAELEDALKKAKERVDHEHARGVIATAAAASGVMPKGIPDIVYRVMNAGQWKYNQHGHLTRHGADSLEEVIETASGLKSITPEMAVEALRQPADHCWPEPDQPVHQTPSRPDTTKQPSKSQDDTGVNPWTAAFRNVTEQIRIYDADPERAARLAAEAGVTP